MFKRFAVVAVVVFPIVCGGAAPSTLSGDDVRVIAAALAHFSTRSDVRPQHPDGYLALEPLTSTLGPNETEESLLDSLHDIRKRTPEEAVTDFVRRNRDQSFSYAIEQGNARVRVHTLEELGGVFGVLQNEQVAHFITLSAPGYTADRAYAFVRFSYIWSIHGAYANYVLKRVKKHWEIVASELQVYP